MSTNADVIRDLIHKENEMINHRMNWFLILQGFMFAGIAFAWDKGQALSIVFSSVGMLSALSVGVLLRSGIKAIEHLEQSNSETNDAVMGKGKGDTPALVHLLLPWNFLPALMMIAWLALMCIRIFPGLTS